MSYPYQPGYSYPPAPQGPPPQNGFGTAGFILGVLGLLFSWIPIVGVIAWPMVLLGIVFAVLGIVRANAGRATNKGLAIAGVACSAVGLAICLLYVVAISAAVSSAPATRPAAAAPSGSATDLAASTAPQPGDAAPAGIGREVRDGDFSFVVTAVDAPVTTLGSGMWSTKAQGEFRLVRVTVTNIGNEAQMFNGSAQKLFDTQGRQFDTDSGAAALYVPDSESFLNNINPGNTVKGVLVFDVPRGLTPAAVELHDSPFSGGVVVSLR